MSSEFVLPLSELFGGDARRMLLQYAIQHPERDWTQKGDIVDETGVSSAAARENFPPLVRYGVYDVRDPDAKFPHYRPADTDVFAALVSWHRNDGYPLVELFGTSGRQDLVEFFLDHADDESYSKTRLSEDGGIHHQAVRDNIDDLVDAGVVREVDGKRGTEYALAEDNDIVAFLYTLNGLLVEAYREREDATG